MSDFLKALLSSDESVADSIVIGGLAALIVLCALAFLNSPQTATFAGGATAIIGAIGGARRLRDGPQP